MKASLLATISAVFQTMNTPYGSPVFGIARGPSTSFNGLMPPNPMKSIYRSRRPRKYMPHQGKQECARRISQGKE